MPQNEPIDDESPGTTSRRQFLGAAAALSTLPGGNDPAESVENTNTSTEQHSWHPYLLGYVADSLVHTAHNELVRGRGDMEKARFLLRHAAALIDAELVDADDPYDVPHRPEWEVEYNQELYS